MQEELDQVSSEFYKKVLQCVNVESIEKCVLHQKQGLICCWAGEMFLIDDPFKEITDDCFCCSRMKRMLSSIQKLRRLKKIEPSCKRWQMPSEHKSRSRRLLLLSPNENVKFFSRKSQLWTRSSINEYISRTWQIKGNLSQAFNPTASFRIGNRRLKEVPQTVGRSPQQHRCSSQQSLGGSGEAEGSAERGDAEKQGI